MDDKILFFDNPKQCIIVMVLVIMIIGGINVFSATFVNQVSYGFVLRYIIFSVVGAAFLLLTNWIGYKKLLKPEYLMLFYILVLAALVFVQFAGPRINGAARWIFLGPISIQPSEFSKLLGVMLCASFLGMRMARGQEVSLNPINFRGAKVFGLMFVQAALVLKQPDMGTMSIIMALVFCMYVLAGQRKAEILALVGVVFAAAAALVMTSSYRMDRMKIWLDPFKDPFQHGYQMCQSLIAIGSGGFTGMEWGAGAGKFWYLPEAHTDFAFAIFCQENGFLGAFLLIVAYCVLAFAFLKVCRDVKDSKAFLLSYGITLLIIGQAVANMCMVTGIFPVIGVPLPFISYGGSSMTVSMIAIGLFLSIIDEETARKKLEAMTPEERRDGIRSYRGGWRS